MTKGSKYGVVDGIGKEKTATEEKEKRSQFSTRIGMDFDLTTTRLHSQE